MSWNYRLCKIMTETPRSLGGGEVATYCIREVYYDKNDKPTSWTESLDLEGWESEKDVRVNLAMMLHDSLRLPVLDLTKKGKKK